MTLADKKILFEQVIKKLEDNLQILVEAAFEAKEASTNEEAKAENKYDTRGLEASYLASGQARRAKELQEQIYQLKKVELREFAEQDPIGISSVVALRVDEKATKQFFLVPVGGVEVDSSVGRLQTLTIDAPLGRHLLGLREDDDFEFNGHVYEIVSVY